MAIFEIAKNGIWGKIFFREIDLFDFTNFFGLDFLKFSSLDEIFPEPNLVNRSITQSETSLNVTSSIIPGSAKKREDIIFDGIAIYLLPRGLLKSSQFFHYHVIS